MHIIRVSSEKQGRSGLGLQAQKEIIKHNVINGEILEWFEEIHSAKDLNNLPQLNLAKEKAKKEGCVLIIAKADRLRNTQQALNLVDELTPAGIFFCNVGQYADKFMLTLFFAFAEKERLEISIRTKAALAVLKSKGVKLGRPFKKKTKEQHARIAKMGAHARFIKSVNDTRNQSAFSIAAVLRAKGYSYLKIATYLNEKGYPTPLNKKWREAGILKLIKKYETNSQTV